jgi:hypothetical protein
MPLGKAMRGSSSVAGETTTWGTASTAGEASRVPGLRFHENILKEVAGAIAVRGRRRKV